MFKLFVNNPFGPYKVECFRAFASLDAAIACAFDHIAAIVPECSVWIEAGDARLVLMEGAK